MLDHVTIAVGRHGPLAAFYYAALKPLVWPVVMSGRLHRTMARTACRISGSAALVAMRATPCRPSPRQTAETSRLPCGLWPPAAPGADNGAPGVRSHYHPTTTAPGVLARRPTTSSRLPPAGVGKNPLLPLRENVRFRLQSDLAELLLRDLVGEGCRDAVPGALESDHRLDAVASIAAIISSAPGGEPTLMPVRSVLAHGRGVATSPDQPCLHPDQRDVPAQFSRRNRGFIVPGAADLDHGVHTRPPVGRGRPAPVGLFLLS